MFTTITAARVRAVRIAAVCLVAAEAAGQSDCVTTWSSSELGTANRRLPAVRGRGYTLLGAPTVLADLRVHDGYPELAARLWDVAPNGQQTLIARGLHRPTGSGRVVFELHANAWRFAPEHVVKLQLLGRDAPFARPSNGTFSITVSNLDLRLPVHERPGTGQVDAPASLVAPCKSRLVRDVVLIRGCSHGFKLAQAESK
jgi:hypothetical protein